MAAVCGYASGAGEGPAGAKSSEVTLRQGCEGCERPLRRRDAVLGASARTVRSLQSEARACGTRSANARVPAAGGGGTLLIAMRRDLAIRLLLGLGVLLTAAATGALAQSWPMFGGDVQSTSA